MLYEHFILKHCALMGAIKQWFSGGYNCKLTQYTKK